MIILTIGAVSASDAILDYITRLTMASREHEAVAVGISPRGALFLERTARARAYLEDRDYAGATDKFTVTATFTQYNAIERIEIPEEVISGAVESDESLIGSLIPGL